MKFGSNDCYRVSSDFETLAVHLLLPIDVWSVFSAFHERVTSLSAAELVKITGLSTSQVNEALERLLVENLIFLVTLTWEEFCELRQNAQAEQSIAVVDSESNYQNGSKPILGSIGNMPNASDVWPNDVISADQSLEKSNSLSNLGGGYRLKSLMEKIESINGGGVEGQLLVYQVFLKVPYQLLHDEGIRSLDLVNDNTLVKSEELYAAIVQATKEVTGFQLQA